MSNNVTTMEHWVFEIDFPVNPSFFRIEYINLLSPEKGPYKAI